MSRQLLIQINPQPNAAPNPTQNTAPIGIAILILLTALFTWKTLHDREASPPENRPKSQPPTISNFTATPAIQWLSQGKDLENAKKYPEAIALYDQALAYHPQDHRLWHERGLALAKLQRFEDALHSYDRAYQLQPNRPDLLHERGDTLLELQRYEEAITAFTTFLRYSPNNPHILADRGYALYKLDRHDEALQSLNAVLTSGRQDPNALPYAHYYQIATLQKLGQLQAALQSSQAALQRYPSDRLHNQQTELQQQIQRLT
jgi:tetratricopeptide (TPR) repeat protein